MKTWKKGDTARWYYGHSEEKEVFAGLYLYHAFGSGDYYSKTGEVVSCCPSESTQLARAEGVRHYDHDTFSAYQSPYLGD